MSLEATHIRFALDLKDSYEVRDMKKYLSGAIYPDSRYITKIDRHLTHDKGFTKESFYKDDDFKKGWSSHLLCDRANVEAILKIFPDLFEGLETEIVGGNKNWVMRTAIKVLQDVADAEALGIKNYREFIDHIETPNGEDPELMKKYAQIFIDKYDTEKLTLEDEFEIWSLFELTPELLEKIKYKVMELKERPDVMERIARLYDEMIRMYK